MECVVSGCALLGTTGDALCFDFKMSCSDPILFILHVVWKDFVVVPLHHVKGSARAEVTLLDLFLSFCPVLSS
jgi:hypothetical protein